VDAPATLDHPKSVPEIQLEQVDGTNGDVEEKQKDRVNDFVKDEQVDQENGTDSSVKDEQVDQEDGTDGTVKEEEVNQEDGTDSSVKDEEVNDSNRDTEEEHTEHTNAHSEVLHSSDHDQDELPSQDDKNDTTIAPEENTLPEPPTPAPVPPIDIDFNEYSPLARHPFGNTPRLTPSAPMHLPDSPSPLRIVTNNSGSSSPYTEESTSSYPYVGAFPSSSPYRSSPPTLQNQRFPATLSTSIIRSTNTSPVRASSNTPNAYEVEAKFMDAMVGLLQRQANIVPEHLFTKAEVKEIVRKELEKLKAAAGQDDVSERLFTKAEVDETVRKEVEKIKTVTGQDDLSERFFTKAEVEEMVRKELREREAKPNALTLMSPKETATTVPKNKKMRSAVRKTAHLANTTTSTSFLGGMAAVMGCAGLSVFRRAYIAHPEMTWDYVDAAWKGALCGLAGAVVIQQTVKAVRAKKNMSM
jgi:hypothetical protein